MNITLFLTNMCDKTNIWNGPNKSPEGFDWTIIYKTDETYVILHAGMFDYYSPFPHWNKLVRSENIVLWAYIEDLLQNSNSTVRTVKTKIPFFIENQEFPAGAIYELIYNKEIDRYILKTAFSYYIVLDSKVNEYFNFINTQEDKENNDGFNRDDNLVNLHTLWPDMETSPSIPSKIILVDHGYKVSLWESNKDLKYISLTSDEFSNQDISWEDVKRACFSGIRWAYVENLIPSDEESN